MLFQHRVKKTWSIRAVIRLTSKTEFGGLDREPNRNKSGWSWIQSAKYTCKCKRQSIVSESQHILCKVQFCTAEPHRYIRHCLGLVNNLVTAASEYIYRKPMKGRWGMKSWSVFHGKVSSATKTTRQEKKQTWSNGWEHLMSQKDHTSAQNWVGRAQDQWYKSW